ncbi:MAG TPA: NAD-dependent epimerase/dehydratase family protein [Polaromonas sp.]|uniref:NAD-dependent epimerase/dehydratase family protein n=1 Tax=Polaromonas sp. TaxID=1869339 RepID=UPI002D48EA3E|nr:NAD-dependent epimerase/dehydratase family protein [Polaromonas sp.]HYW58413.1 NAD-dependent epimerase/dehydratase family protein [Polaromonas sp.]
MNHPPSVLILGARGRFGRAATQAFASAGWTVLAQRRSPRAVSGAVHPLIRWVDLDVEDTAALAAQARGVSVVIHAMNAAYTNAAWRTEAPGQMRAAIAVAKVLDALLTFPGNVYNFGATMPGVLREDTPQRPSNAKGEVRVGLEQQLEEAAQAHGLVSAVIRAGDFFGSGTGSLFDRVLVPKIAKGRMGYPAALHIPTAWAYLPDLAQTFVRVAQRREVLRGAQTFHFRGYQLTGQDWLDAITPVARARGWLAEDAQLKVDALPWPLLRVLGVVMPTMQSLVETRYVWNTPHALDNSRLQALIGTEPHTPLAQAVQQALADLLTDTQEPALRSA